MSEKLDVLIVTQFFPPESMGGAHRWEKFAANLDEDIEPHVLTTQPTFPFGEFDHRWKVYSRESMDGVPVTRLFTYQPTRDSVLARILNYGVFSLLSSLYVLLTFWRYDCIVTMSAPHTAFLPGLVGKLTRRRWIIDIFDLWIDNAADLGYVEEGSLTHRIVNRLESAAFANADAVTVITKTMAEYYESKYPNFDFDIHIIPFGVDRELFAPDVDSSGSTDIIYTGNLGTGQAFEPYFRGFAKLDGEPELLIIGDGERREELETLSEHLNIADRVTFEGYVPRSEIPEMVAGAKVSIVPLKTEYQLDYAQPTKLLETMAVGTPYVASNVTEIDSLSQRFGCGIAVQNEPRTISEAISGLISDRERREALGQRGIETIQSHHDWSEIGGRFSSILRSLAPTTRR